MSAEEILPPGASRKAPATRKPTKATPDAKRVATAVDRDDVEFPCAMYRKRNDLKRFPDGYETRRVESASERADLGPAWKDSPAGMAPPAPVEADPDDDLDE